LIPALGIQVDERTRYGTGYIGKKHGCYQENRTTLRCPGTGCRLERTLPCVYTLIMKEYRSHDQRGSS